MFSKHWTNITLFVYFNFLTGQESYNLSSSSANQLEFKVTTSLKLKLMEKFIKGKFARQIHRKDHKGTFRESEMDRKGLCHIGNWTKSFIFVQSFLITGQNFNILSSYTSRPDKTR